MVTIEIVQGAELARVGEFYKSTGYGGGVSEADLTLAAKVDGRLAGAVRLCHEGGVIVLRGMQVDPAYQRKGIGHFLLTQCIPYLDWGTAYCLPYAHLVEFYCQGGFVLAKPATLPPFLAARLAGYVLAGQRVLAMRRVGAGAV
jgi:GNAT superfamily N-acetyltransferase